MQKKKATNSETSKPQKTQEKGGGVKNGKHSYLENFSIYNQPTSQVNMNDKQSIEIESNTEIFATSSQALKLHKLEVLQ